MKGWDYSQIWYHGSPFELEYIYKRSTITQDRHLAEVFSHKPEIVADFDDGRIKHNGELNGYLYLIDEKITEEDVYPHPDSNMSMGKEWLTTRALKVKLITSTEVAEEELFSQEEIARLRSKMGSTEVE